VLPFVLDELTAGRAVLDELTAFARELREGGAEAEGRGLGAGMQRTNAAVPICWA